MTFLEQLQVPATWSAADGERSWPARLLAPAQDTALWQVLVFLGLAALALCQAVVNEVDEGAFGKLVVLLALGGIGLGQIARRVVQAQRSGSGLSG